jgi:hypothetical protein
LKTRRLSYLSQGIGSLICTSIAIQHVYAYYRVKKALHAITFYPLSSSLPFTDQGFHPRQAHLAAKGTFHTRFIFFLHDSTHIGQLAPAPIDPFADCL